MCKVKSLAVIAASVLLSAFISPAQQRQDSAPPSAEWRKLISKIQAVLDESEFKCPIKDREWVGILQTADVTGDGIPEALVEYCHMGAYTSDIELMQLEHDSPVVARFRDKNGKTATPSFLEGSSVMNGEATKLLPESHAVCAIHWHMDEYGKLGGCTVEAYAWDPTSATFNENEKLSKEVAQSECRKLRKELEGSSNPPNSKK